MLAIAEAAPKSPEGFDALLWIVRHHFPFFDANEERASTLGKAVNMLIRDHLDYIDGHLDDRTVAEGFNHWNPIPEPARRTGSSGPSSSAASPGRPEAGWP